MQEIERINGIKPYFQQLNVEGENVYIWATFPNGWIIPTSEELNESFGINIVENAEDGGGYLFYTQIEKGFAPVFDAVEYVIAYNKTLEEKNNLLIEYANKLRDLFVEKSLEELKTLQFVFSSTSKKEKKEDSKNNTDSIVKALPKLKKSEIAKNGKAAKQKTVDKSEVDKEVNDKKSKETLSMPTEEKEAKISGNPLLDFANEMVEKS